MPVVSPSSYRRPLLLLSGHLQTIVPALFRRMRPLPPAERERIETGDGDFLDLDWFRQGNRRLAVISHGLEGSSRAGYVRGMAAALLGAGWDVLAWNFRSCSGELNRSARFYHSGDTTDLREVLRHGLGGYPIAALVGFSLGGNVILKFLGEEPERVPGAIRTAVTFSVPCDLPTSAARLDLAENRVYTRRFLRSLQRKVKEKARAMPGSIDPAGVESIRSFEEFDGRYTAPMHGFRDAMDYWKRSSCRPFLPRIRIPCLLVNARNDPFLSPECYPEEEARASGCFFLEMPESGGHVGFSSFGGLFWSEARTIEFLQQHARRR
jgi:uncharacterized protein